MAFSVRSVTQQSAQQAVEEEKGEDLGSQCAVHGRVVKPPSEHPRRRDHPFPSDCTIQLWYSSPPALLAHREPDTLSLAHLASTTHNSQA